MRIILDMQGAQTESRFRGIGRYILSLTQAIVRNRGEHEIFLVLNGLFSDSIEPIRAIFDGILPQENIFVWYAPGPVRESQINNRWRREAAERIREAFLASLKPDIVHVFSLFEGFVDDAVTSIGLLAPRLLTTITLYDLIPLSNPGTYLTPNPAYEEYYLRKIEHMKRADGWLAISQFSAAEATQAFGEEDHVAVDVSCACDDIFHPMNFTDHERQSLFRHYGIEKAFVLYIGAADERKNLPALIRAFAQLSIDLRQDHQLVLVGKITESEQTVLNEIAQGAGLQHEEIIFLGYIPDVELVRIYNLCKVFVFPSWHEGFGLPVLEAMSCGRAVIAADTSSLPEVVGRTDALFNPFSIENIAQKLSEVLQTDSFRLDLERHGLMQAKRFSWDKSAKIAMEVFENLYSKHQRSFPYTRNIWHRPRLAYVSPLPPERTGIAHYSAELLPELTAHYDVEVIVAQDIVSDPWIRANSPIRSVQWFREHFRRYDRILYHFGNSPFHAHMFSLLEEAPGIVVLHDFYLSDLIAHLELHDGIPAVWSQALWESHGYQALWERLRSTNPVEVTSKYPCNLAVLQTARGVIVHSEYSRQLAECWYGTDASKDWAVIPLVRRKAQKDDHALARCNLDFSEDDFVVCTFGFLDSSKLNHRLIQAWSQSTAGERSGILVFVGENHGGDYGREILAQIHASGLAPRVRVTGWVDKDTYRQYLAAADLAVQLRASTRGESSSAVLDCMSHGIPTIVNAHGSLADLSDEAVWKLPDNFSTKELIVALDTLRSDDERRKHLGEAGRAMVLRQHAPKTCATLYAEAIERCYGLTEETALIQSIAKIDGSIKVRDDLVAVATAIGQSFAPFPRQRQCLLDISVVHANDLRTGIERVVRAILLQWLKNPPIGYRVEPVYASAEHGYRYAKRFTAAIHGDAVPSLEDEPVEIYSGDLFLGLDFIGGHLASIHHPFYQRMRRDGAKIWFIVHDLLPVRHKEWFPPRTDGDFTRWLSIITEADGAICVSHSTADDLLRWCQEEDVSPLRPYRIAVVHNGATLKDSLPSRGAPSETDELLHVLQKYPIFLMVGTIEPRKGYGQTLAAFDLLWHQGVEINLVIVGTEGWRGLQHELRRNIPQLTEMLHQHPQRDQHLFWLQGISDEYLESLYKASTCLIAASEGEGFGLPLIEAALHHLPIIARDIPVFREVAGPCAHYYSGTNSEDLAAAIMDWLCLYNEDRHPKSGGMPWLTWEQSAKRLKEIVFDEDWLYQIEPGGQVTERAKEQKQTPEENIL